MDRRHSNSLQAGAIIVVLLLAGYCLLASLFDLEDGEQRSHAELQAIFAQNVQSFEKLVALCGDQPTLRYVERSTDYTSTYKDIAPDELLNQGWEFRKALRSIDAVGAYCSWAFDIDPPRFHALEIRYYFDSNRQGRFGQEIVYFPNEPVVHNEAFLDNKEGPFYTALPKKGWYIWEQGIDHETTAP